ncbi:MAG: DUF3990 domain-containing protein [Defluviitaleaceae bacterium]|nr:DUF3990 domain-containing protein [Defluviitaleaceae bacterium]
MSSTITLYHGTTHCFKKPDIHKGKPFKDFGQGFYLSAHFDHARNLALRNRKIEEFRRHIIGNEKKLPVFIYAYEFDISKMNQLNVKHFKAANREWLKFIIANRMSKIRQHEYDIVIGPTANDDTRTAIRTAINASNGAIMNDAALDLLIELLEPGNLPEQYYFGTNKAAKLLIPAGRDEIK